MRNLMVLACALDWIEANLTEPISVEEVANACYVSTSGLHKLFGYVFGMAVGVYLTKRRLSAATKELLAKNASVTDVAYRYQYGSPEAFSRAFKRFWGISPSAFRKQHRNAGLFPRFTLDEKKGDGEMSRKRVDITELYEELRRLGGTWALCIDIHHLKYINDTHGIASGDLAIAEAFRRVDEELTEEMLLFRIGKDEFAVVTASKDLEAVKRLAGRILAKNGNLIAGGEHTFALSLYAGICRVPQGAFGYDDALAGLHDALGSAKANRDFLAVIET